MVSSSVGHLVGLLQSVEEGLEAGEVSHQLEYPQDPHHADQADHLPSLPDNLEVLQPLEDEGEVEGDDGEQVDEVHGALDELELVGADGEPHEVLQGEEHHHEVVDEVYDVGQQGELQVALGVLLQLLKRMPNCQWRFCLYSDGCSHLRGGDDEGDGADEDHREAEQGQELGEAARPRVPKERVWMVVSG